MGVNTMANIASHSPSVHATMPRLQDPEKTGKKARASFRNEDYQNAERLYEKVLQEFIHNYGPHDRMTLITTCQLAATYLRSKKCDKAHLLIGERVVAAMGENSRSAAQLCHLWGEALATEKKYSEAEVWYRRAWKTNKILLGETNRDTLRSAYGLAKTLTYLAPRNGTSKLVEANMLALRIHDSFLVSPETLGSKEAIQAAELCGLTYAQMGNYEAAETYSQIVYSRVLKVYGSVHEKTAEATYALGKCLHKQGKNIWAEWYLRKSYNFYRTRDANISGNAWLRHLTAYWLAKALFGLQSNIEAASCFQEVVDSGKNFRRQYAAEAATYLKVLPRKGTYMCAQTWDADWDKLVYYSP